MITPFLGSILLFAVVYVFLTIEKIEKSVVVLIGAVCAIAFRFLSFDDAIKYIDINVLFLLIGMMTCVGILSETGFFEWVAIYIAKLMRGNGFCILGLLMLVTMVFSAFLDNVTCIILLAPVTILLTQLLEIRAAPFLILEALASNVGGTATLIGDPPNIILGSKADLSFNDFLINLTPCVFLVGIIFILSAILILRRDLSITARIRARINDIIPELAITDSLNMKKSLAIFGLMFIGFFFQRQLHFESGMIALFGAALMIFICNVKCENAFKKLEMDTIMFFIGLFILVGALEHNGVIKYLADELIRVCHGDKFITCMAILWGSAIVSAFINNIPFIIVMVPLLNDLMTTMPWTVTPHSSHPLYWALALGVCIGGNGTLIGASANVIAANIGNKNGQKITFLGFTRYGFPLMIQAMIICSVYLWYRYFYNA